MSEREKAVQRAADDTDPVPRRWNEARRFIAMHDALRAHDARATHKPYVAEPGKVTGSPMRRCGYCHAWAMKPCGNGCQWSQDDPLFVPEVAPVEPGKHAEPPTTDPVAVVREAMARLPKPDSRYSFWDVQLKIPPSGEWAAQHDAKNYNLSAALATILNNLPALLDECEARVPNGFVQAEVARAERNGFRSGVIKGLEMAASTAWRHERDHPIALGSRLDSMAKNIRSGGAIDGETGGTPAVSSESAAVHSAPEGQTQAGGAPGLPLPKGWFNETTIKDIERDEDPSMDEAKRLCGMARAAIKLREALVRIAYGDADSGHSPHFGIARAALASLETANG